MKLRVAEQSKNVLRNLFCLDSLVKVSQYGEKTSARLDAILAVLGDNKDGLLGVRKSYVQLTFRQLPSSEEILN